MYGFGQAEGLAKLENQYAESLLDIGIALTGLVNFVFTI